MKRRILSILTALVLAFGLCSPLAGLAPEAEAAEIIDSGQCGDGLTWKFDSDGTMTISGTGEMYYYYDYGIPWNDYRAQIKKLVVESGVTSIYDNTFSDCYNMELLTIADTVTYIGDRAFEDCKKIREVYLPDSITELGSNVFSNCISLESVNIPRGITTIPKDAFSFCCFSSIVIPDNVTKIGDSAFSAVSELSSITLPDGLTWMGESAFSSTDLESIRIPEGMTEIANTAFMSCDKLKTVILPKSITDIGWNAFAGCSSIQDVYFAGSAEEWDAIEVGLYNQQLLNATIHYNSTGPGSESEPEGPAPSIPTPILDDPACTKEGVSLSWTLPLELPEEPYTVDGFYILRKTAGGSYERIGQVGEHTHLYTDTSVQDGQTYTYTVQAYYQDQTGDYDQTGKTITYVRPVTVPVAAEVRKTEFRIEGGEIGLTTDTLWTGAQSKVYIYIKEDVGIEHGSDPGYVVLTERESGKQLWRSDTIHYYSSDSIAESHHFDFVFEPEECDGGYLPSGTEVQFQIRDEQGDLILTCDCETFPLQLWSFNNPSDTFDQAFLEQFYSESRAKAIFKLAKADTLGGDGLCVGMSLLVSLINSDGIGDIGFEGCEELGQVKKDTPLTGPMEGYTALDLIKACQARQYFDSIVRQRKENREDLTGLIDAVESYERGIGAMPVVIISVPQENGGDYTHALAAYAAEEDEQGNMRIDVYDPNHPDIIGSYLTIYDPGEEDAFWLYREQFKGGEGEMGIYDESLLDAAFKKYGLTYFTSRSYPMQQEDDIWVDIAGYDFSALKDGGLEINVLDPDRFQGLSAAWVSGQGTLDLPGLTGQAEIADDETAYTIDADGGSASLTLKEGVDTVKVTGDGTLTIACTYEGERGTVTTRFSGKSEDGVTVDRTGDTVRFSGGDSGKVTVSYEDGKTWTEQVEQDKDLAVTADGKNEPSTTGAAPAVPDSVRFFLDISPDDYFYDAVAWAVENGVTAGTGANTFSPHRPCTRGEIVTLLWRSLGLDELSSRSTYDPFVDVDPEDYFCDAVLWAAENGITTGTSADHFSPDKACTRAEVVTFLWRSHFPTELVMDGTGFSDVHAWDYYWIPVNWAVKEGITTGTGGDAFSPDMVCTRAQVVTFLYRYLGG